jgi:hypothetical protein
MTTIRPETANEWMRQVFQTEERQAQSPHAEESAPWEPKCPFRWPEFQTWLIRYCHDRGWEVIAADDSCAIFAHGDQSTDEALQAQLPFEEDPDALPF